MSSSVIVNIYNNPRSPSFLIVRWLLLFGIIISPFTALRFGILGVGELCLLTAILSFFLIGRFTLRIENMRFIITGFWIPFIVISLIGACYHFIYLNGVQGTLETAAFDLFSYIFITLLLMILGDIRVFGNQGPLEFFFKVYKYLVSILIILYITSPFTPSLFGFSLKYYDYFAPLVDNTHQISMITCVLPFIGLAFWKSGVTIVSKAFIIGSFPLLCLMAFESGSSKAIIGIILGISVALLLMLLTSVFGRVTKVVTMLLFLATVLYIIFSPQLQQLFSLFNDIDGGGARFFLYAEGFRLILESPLVGYGPGPHILRLGEVGRFSDAHNSFITLGLQAGLPGIILVALLFAGFIKRAFSNPWLIGALASFTIYLSGGDILRRVPIWIILSMVVYLSQHEQKARSS